MAEYYLISQLPSLDGISDTMPLPISKETFMELCENNLNKKVFNELEKATIKPAKDFGNSSSSVLNAWNEEERNLRLVLASVRANKMELTFDSLDAEKNPNAKRLIKVAETATEMESPMEAERFLNDYRLEFLETLRPMDSFSEEYIFYYSLKLDLLSRIRKFDEEIGRNEYKNMYNSIMNSEKREETL